MLHFMNCYRNNWLFSCFVVLCLLFVTYCCEYLWNLIYLLLFSCARCCQKEGQTPFPTPLFVSSFYKYIFYKNSRFHRCILCFMV